MKSFPAKQIFLAMLFAVNLSLPVPVAGAVELTLDGGESQFVALFQKKATMLYAEGKYDEAIKAAFKSLEFAEKTYDEESLELVEPLNVLGLLHRMYGRNEKALEYHLSALAILDKHLPSNDSRRIETLNNAALAYEALSRFPEAEGRYQESLSIMQVQGAKPEERAMVLNNLAGVYRSQGKYLEAEGLYKEAFEIWEQDLEKNVDQIAKLLNNMGILYQEKKDFEKAVEFQKRALALRQKTYGFNHLHVAVSLNNLGSLYRELGQFEKAEEHYLRALKIWRDSLGENHPNVLHCLNNLAYLYMAEGKPEKAEVFYLQVLDKAEKSVDLKQQPAAVTAAASLVQMYTDLGQSDKARLIQQRMK